MWAISRGGQLRERCRTLLRDQSGAYDLIQIVLVLPILITILYGSFELMKLASLRQTLEAGTYQAARYLSAYHKTYANSRYNRTVDDRVQAERLIRESLLSNTYLAEDTGIQLVVRYYNGQGLEIASPVDFPCDTLAQYVSKDPRSLQLFSNNFVFTVRAWATIPWRVSVLGIAVGNVTLNSSHTSFVDCGPWYPPLRPTPTPSPTPDSP